MVLQRTILPHGRYWYARSTSARSLRFAADSRDNTAIKTSDKQTWRLVVSLIRSTLSSFLPFVTLDQGGRGLSSTTVARNQGSFISAKEARGIQVIHSVESSSKHHVLNRRVRKSDLF